MIKLTALGLFLAILAMHWVTGPWQWEWRFTPTEEPWFLLVVSQAGAVLLLNYRRPLAWLGFVAAVPFCLAPAALGLEGSLIWRAANALSMAFANPMLGRAIFWLGAIAACGIVVKAATNVDWSMALARSAIGVIGSLATSEALLWLIEIWHPQDRRVAFAAEVVVFLVPAVVLPALLWRNWNRIAAWTGASLASVLLTGVLVLDLHRMTLGTGAVAAVLASIGPVWAYFDWRRSCVAERARGFEVLATTTAL
jgi:hypothetical protein